MALKHFDYLIDNFYPDVKHAEKDAIKFVKMALGTEKLKILGEGAYGVVRGCDMIEDVAFKTGNMDDNWGYLKFLDIVKKNQNNPFFPQIGNVSVFKDEDDMVCFSIEMEKLIDGDVYFKHNKLGEWDNFVKEISLRIENLQYSNNPLDEYISADIKTSFTFKGASYKLPNTFYEAVYYLEDTRTNDGNLEYDLHGGNFMMRPNGQLVIIDPLV